jgi:flagellar protein FliO/FliZ
MASILRLRFSTVLAAWLPAVANAQTAAQSAAPSANLSGNLLQLVLGLGFVIALLFASLWLLKRISAPRGEAAGLLRVVAGTAVGPRERVVILEVGGTWMVLGVAPGQVSALAEIPRGSLATAPNAPPAGNLPGWLQRIVDRRHAR